MTANPTPDRGAAVDRIPLAHSVRYVARGLPEVPNQYGPGVLAPSEITLTYRAAPDSGLGRVHAYVAGRIWVDGTELPLMTGGLYGQHYDDGLDGWPEWLAEEARLHDPAASAVVAVAAPPTVWIDGHPQLEAIAARVWERCRTEDTSTVVDDPRNIAVAALAAVLDLLPPPADRVAILREEAALIRAHCPDHLDSDSADGAWMDCHCAVADDMERRLADEPQPEAHPAEHKWAAELYDPLAEEWVPGTRYMDRDRAVNALAHAKRLGPTWKDGTPTERRLVRTTTTYTVEPPAVVSAVPPQPEETGRPSEIVHGCPPDGSGLTPCCGRTPFELPLTDRISSEAPVTCPGKEA